MIEFEHYDKPVKNTDKNFKNLIFRPLIYGMLGFVGFFIVLTGAKFLGYVLGSLNTFEIDLEDFYLCIVGFFLSFLIKFLENFQENKKSIGN